MLLHSKTSPLIQKTQAHGNHESSSPQASIVEFFLPFSRFNSLPASKCAFLCLFGSPLMCFGVLVAHFLQNLWSNSHVNWGVVGDGPRPTLHFEAMGHATLPPSSWYSCLNMRPPSVQWNASMAFAHDFGGNNLWDNLVCVCLLFLSMYSVS